MADPISSSMPPLPNYRDAGISNLVPSIFLHLARSRGSLFGKSSQEIEDRVRNINFGVDPELESWFPKEPKEASQIVLLVLDGLGFTQLTRFWGAMPSLAGFSQIPISSVAPTTTATALTSISTGATPSTHGILGYRMRVGGDRVMNTLSWACQPGMGQQVPTPEDIQTALPFMDFNPKVVTKAQYQNSGFTKAHLRGTDIVDYRLPSTMVVHVSELLRRDVPFIYTYYEGIDTVAHEYGLGEFYLEELKAVDYFIGRLLSVLPSGASLLITADHGQVEVPDPPIVLDPKILKHTELLSGEGRFRWLHVKKGMVEDVVDLATELYGDVAWAVSKDELVEGGYYGGALDTAQESARLGDVAIIAKGDVAFYDPADTGPYNLVCRHGSLTQDELEVPLLGYLA